MAWKEIKNAVDEISEVQVTTPFDRDGSAARSDGQYRSGAGIGE